MGHAYKLFHLYQICNLLTTVEMKLVAYKLDSKSCHKHVYVTVVSKICAIVPVVQAYFDEQALNIPLSVLRVRASRKMHSGVGDRPKSESLSPSISLAVLPSACQQKNACTAGYEPSSQ